MITIPEENFIPLDSLITKLNANLVRSQKSHSLNFSNRQSLRSELHWLNVLKELLEKKKEP